MSDNISLPQWTINPDGSITITLSAAGASFFAETLIKWRHISEPGYTQREDCQNWKRSPIARENRRETIVYGNCLSSIECALGRRDVLALLRREGEKEQSP